MSNEDIIKNCKHHGDLTIDECCVYKCWQYTKIGRKDYIGYRCKACYKSSKDKWLSNNKEKARESRKRNYQKNKAKHHARVIKWQKENPDKHKIIRERFKKKNPTAQTIACRKWRAKNPEKYKAHMKVFNAIQKGVLMREPCSVCGEGKAHAHHEDYTKPLDVIWLCLECHRRTHPTMDRSCQI